MYFNVQKQTFITLLLAMMLLSLTSGCAVQTHFSTIDPVAPAPVKADNYIFLRSIELNGKLKKHADSLDLKSPIIGGFATIGNEIKAKQDSTFTDASLDIKINTKVSTRNADKIKNIPLVGGLATVYSGNSVTFNLTTEVDYSLQASDGSEITNDSFLIKGQDTLRINSIKAGLGVYTGASVLTLGYPDAEKTAVLAPQIFTSIGQEIAARLRKGASKDFLIARTDERDGMSPQAYAEFVAKKDRIKEQRAKRNTDIRKQLTAQIDNKNDTDRLGNGGLMVFGIGVDQYENFPDLQYAASDCRNLVGWFKSTYALTGDQATCLTNENASAIKVNRFLKRNAAQMLDENDTFVFYFSGHGAPEQSSYSRDGDGLNKYLLLSNTETDAMDMTAVNLSKLFETIDKLPAKRKIILLDSCFSGEAGRTVLAGLKGISLSEKTYQNLTKISGKGTVILAASSENQLSQERDDIGAGLFTHFLVNGLKGKADNNTNGKVDILELYAYVTKNVEKTSKGKQTPVLRGQLNRTIEF